MVRALIVDDSMIARRHVKKLVRAFGADVVEAEDGLEGLACLKRESFDIMLMDLLMPKMTGLELLAAKRDAGISVPTLVLTADIQKTTHEKCMELGAIDIIGKPVAEEKLRQAWLSVFPEEA